MNHYGPLEWAALAAILTATVSVIAYWIKQGSRIDELEEDMEDIVESQKKQIEINAKVEAAVATQTEAAAWIKSALTDVKSMVHELRGMALRNDRDCK